MRDHRYYPELLVGLQFGIIGLMLLFSKGLLHSGMGMAIFVVGAILGLWALQHNRLGNFNIQPRIKHASQLVTSGIYKYIRHPMYSSVLLMMLGVWWSTPTGLEGLLFGLLVVVLWLKAQKEESLWLDHDETYKAYRQRTKFFIPFIL